MKILTVVVAAAILGVTFWWKRWKFELEESARVEDLIRPARYRFLGHDETKAEDAAKRRVSADRRRHEAAQIASGSHAKPGRIHLAS